MKSLDGKKFVKKKKMGEEDGSDDDDGEDGSLPTAKPDSKDADDIADMEVSQLWERLKSTVEDVAASDLTGKKRRDHMMAKVARLAGMPGVPNHAATRAPFRIRMGIQEAEKKREKKVKESTREMDGVVAARPYSQHQSKKNSRNRRR